MTSADRKAPDEPGLERAWDRYWSDGRVVACQAGQDDRYSGVIAGKWEAFFGMLPAGSNLLDLATGNGGVPELAVQALGQAQLPATIHGVDRAAIKPRLPEQPRPGLRCFWHGNTSNESLPFVDASFDAVVSQYGVEYGDLGASIDEACRVLKPGGRIHWICHWREGDIAVDAKDEARRAAKIRTLKIPQKINRLIDIQQRGGHFILDSHRRTWQTPEAAEVKRVLAEGFRLARCRPHEPSGNLGLFLHNLAHLYQYRESHSVAEVKDKMKECDQELFYHQSRLEALAAAALNSKSLDEIETRLAAHQVEVDSRDLITEPASGRVVGIEIAAQKSGATRFGPGMLHPEQTRHWTEYWQGGATTSFGEGRFEEGYDDVLGEFWQRVSQAVADDETVVDLGAGNGAILRAVAEALRARGVRARLIGVDAAGIRLDDLDELDAEPLSVALYPHTPMEQTTLPERSVDRVLSNFAVEYSALDKTLRELARIMKSQGMFHAVVHHRDSAVVTQARENADGVGRMLEKPGLFECAVAMAHAAERNDLGRYREHEQELRQVVQRCDGASGGAAYARTIADQLMQLVTGNPEQTHEARLQLLDQFSHAVHAWLHRMRDISNAAMSDAEIGEMLARMEASGFERVSREEMLARNGKLIGHVVVARRI